jgi:hypothetical protein
MASQIVKEVSTLVRENTKLGRQVTRLSSLVERLKAKAGGKVNKPTARTVRGAKDEAAEKPARGRPKKGVESAPTKKAKPTAKTGRVVNGSKKRAAEKPARGPKKSKDDFLL